MICVVVNVCVCMCLKTRKCSLEKIFCCCSASAVQLDWSLTFPLLPTCSSSFQLQFSSSLLKLRWACVYVAKTTVKFT